MSAKCIWLVTVIANWFYYLFILFFLVPRKTWNEIIQCVHDSINLTLFQFCFSSQICGIKRDHFMLTNMFNLICYIKTLILISNIFIWFKNSKQYKTVSNKNWLSFLPPFTSFCSLCTTILVATFICFFCILPLFIYENKNNAILTCILEIFPYKSHKGIFVLFQFHGIPLSRNIPNLFNLNWLGLLLIFY